MSIEITFRIIVAALLVIMFSISGYYRRRANRETGEEVRYGEDEVKWSLWVRTIGALLFYGSMLLYLVYPPLVNWAQVELPLWLRWTGIGLMVVAVPLIYWMFSSLDTNISPTVVTREQHTLVTAGPYRWIRHPLYTFATLNFIGLILVAANWFMLVTAIVALWALHVRTPLEEQRLVDAFGDEYRQYMQRTGRYLPKLGG
jgi:protein-S-isoprenylcysteine O-methyltransferase Ste14